MVMVMITVYMCYIKIEVLELRGQTLMRIDRSTYVVGIALQQP